MGSRLLPAAAAVVAAALAGIVIVAVLQHVASTEQAVERRALLARNADLTRSALTPGSALACLADEAGEKTGDACEAAVFASPQAVAAAVAFEGERLAILKAGFELSKQGDARVMTALAAARRAAELDRYGLAAHVLAVRDGCTAARCPALAMFGDATALKANLKAQAFETYVARHASQWGKPAEAAPAPTAAAPPVAPLPPVASVTPAPPAHEATATPHAVDRRWSFPSADSIPPVSIMNAEPKLPKSAELPEPKADPDLAKAVGGAQAPTPLPPSRRSGEAAPAAAPR